MNKEAIIEQINQLLIDEFDIEGDNLAPETKLRDDLDIDSLDAIDLIIALEKSFGCRIVEEEARKMTTLGQVYDFIIAAKG